MSASELLLLEQLPGVGPATVRRLVRRFGTPGAALKAPDGPFAEAAGGVHARAAAAGRRDPKLHGRVRSALDRAADYGMSILAWDDDLYPAALHHLPDPPPVLFLAGNMELLGRAPSVAVVGARRSTARARDVAGRLGAALAREGVAVFSGLALGVDGAAHAGTLRVGGDTLAVLGTGVDVPYPRFHRRLHDEIRRRGLLVSEFLPGTRAAPHHFPRRNRILAALASTVVVVEAGARSGALITVDHALDLGRDIWAVPGPIDSRACEGSNRLLSEGARPLASVDDFVAEVVGATGVVATAEGVEATKAVETTRVVPTPDLFARAPGEQRPSTAAGPRAAPGAPTPAQQSSRVAPDSLEDRVLHALKEGSAQADELARRFDAPIATVLAVLTTLELHGEVERLEGMRFRRAA